MYLDSEEQTNLSKSNLELSYDNNQDLWHLFVGAESVLQAKVYIFPNLETLSGTIHHKDLSNLILIGDQLGIQANKALVELSDIQMLIG